VIPKKLVAVTTLKSLPEGKATLVKHGKRRLACVRSKGAVHVLEDACPHEGHPLSMGLVRDGVLTCPWHNWKFELGTGHCVFGGESARRIDSEVLDGEVFVAAATDEARDRDRTESDMRRAMRERRVDGATREGLRLALHHEDAPFELLLDVALAVAPYGLGEPACAVGAARRLMRAGVLTYAEALATAAEGICRAPMGVPMPEGDGPASDADRNALLEALLEERRSEAVARAVADERPFEELAASTFYPFASLKLFDGGLAVVRIAMAAVLARSFPGHAAALRGATARMLGWAVARSDLPSWRATRGGIADALRGTSSGESHEIQGTYTDHLLLSERKAVTATLAHLRAGVAAKPLLQEAARAAAHRLAHYDARWSIRGGSTVTVAEPAVGLIFARAARELPADARFGAPLAVQVAGLLGRLGRVSLPSSGATLPMGEASRDHLRDVVLASALAEANPALALLAADALAEDHASLALVRPILDEPRGARIARLALNAERVVRTRKPHDGID
jgi:nitrite reductase/ring-hydroxylating ferredoxin subunit